MEPKDIIAIATVIASIIGTASVSKNHWADKIEQVSKESQHHLEEFRSSQEQLAEKKETIYRIQRSMEELESRYNHLNQLYKKCTTATGTELIVPSLDDNWYNNSLRTGAALCFKLASSTMRTRLKRITKDGPVLVIENCDHPYVRYGVAMPDNGPNSFLIRKGSELVILASTECCDKGFEAANPRYLEKISIHCDSFDVAEQTATLISQKCFFRR